MKIINEVLYIEFQEMVTAGVPANTLFGARNKKLSSWCFIDDPSDNRKVLIKYDSLRKKHKDLYIRAFGNPYSPINSRAIDKYMIAKPEDIDFLENYKISEGRFLPKDKLKAYVAAVSVLNFCSAMADRKKIASIGISDMKTLWELVAAYIKRSGADLPCNVKRLQSKLKEYEIEGPQCVVSAHWQNNRASKLKDEVSAALLLEMIAHNNQFDDNHIARLYNAWAKENNHKTISRSTVFGWRHKNKLTTTIGRYGVDVFHNKFDKIVGRDQASAPLLCINSDDNHLDLFFRDGSNKYCRYKLVVVIDTFKNYPLGWAIGEEVTIDLVREAYLNAIHHVRELTGGYYGWGQIQADKWGESTLKDWYQRQAVYISAKVPGNKRKNRIEASFANTGWHQLLKRYPNYNGHNLPAKSKANFEAIRINAKNFPEKDQAHAQVTHFIQALRQWRKDETSPTKQQMWLQAWKDMPENRKLILSDKKRVLVYGKQHTWRGKKSNEGNTITNNEIIITLNGQRIRFAVPEADYKQHVGTTLQIAYDPYDLTRVIAYSHDEQIQIECPLYENYRDIVMDMQEGDRGRLNNLLDEKKRFNTWAINEQQKRKETLAIAGVSAESILLAGVHAKSLQHYAEQKYLEETIEGPKDSGKPDWANVVIPDDEN